MSGSNNQKAKFSKATVEIIAGRAGYRCSFPLCNKATIGPGAHPGEVAITGTAAHIFSKSPKGPRGQGELSYDKLCNPENGIWLCEVHGKLIDTNRGEKYSAPLLLSYKSYHEARIAREQGGVRSPFGWLQSLHISGSPIFKNDQDLNLGKLTVLIGSNGTGKTALCELIRGLGDPASLNRWLIARRTSLDVSYQATYFDPEERRIDVTCQNHRVIYLVNGKESPFNPFAPRIVHLKETRPRWDEQNDLDIVAEQLGVDPLIIRNILPKLGSFRYGRTRQARIVDTEGGARIIADIETTHPGLLFRQLSSGEQACLAIDVAIALASSSAEYYPTILILDDVPCALDKELLAQYLEELGSSNNVFQAICVFPHEKRIEWKGWERVLLVGIPPNVHIDQSPVDI